MTRNIVLVTFDSLRADHCGLYGYDRNTTPTLDAMAEDGLVFENAVASGVPTVASMTAVMTGEHSLASPELGAVDAQRREITTRRKIAEVLSEAGYATGALSPNPPASSYFGFDEGFDWFEDFLTADRGVLGRYWHRIFRRSMEVGGGMAMYLRLFRNVLKREEVLRPWTDYYDRILEWRESIAEPYFLWVLLLEPHHPWLPSNEYQQWSSRLDKYRSFKHYWEMLSSGWEPDFDQAVRRRLVNLYDDSIRFGDAFLERLQADLADDDPVFMIHADHGEEFGEQRRYGHQPYLTEELIHVPLVVSGLDRSDRVRRPVGLRSIAPTVTEIAGTPHGFDAASLFDDGARPWVESKVFAGGNRRLSIRTNRLKYVRNGTRAIFDLEGDSEAENVSTAMGDVTDALESLVDRHVSFEREKRTIRETTQEVSTRG